MTDVKPSFWRFDKGDLIVIDEHKDAELFDFAAECRRHPGTSYPMVLLAIQLKVQLDVDSALSLRNYFTIYWDGSNLGMVHDVSGERLLNPSTLDVLLAMDRADRKYQLELQRKRIEPGICAE